MGKIEDKDIDLYIDRETLLQEYIPKAQYEQRLKADMVATLTELKTEIKEMQCLYHYVNEYDVSNLIQQKIDRLKEQIDEIKDNNSEK